MNLGDFDYELPDELIAQEPLLLRDSSRLLVLDRASGGVAHRSFADLSSELRSGDLLVLNDTQVIAARLHGEKDSGGRVEMLLVEPAGGPAPEPVWRCLLDVSRSPRPGSTLRFPQGLTADVIGRDAGGWTVRLRHRSGDPLSVALSLGEMPLPPYIRRTAHDPRLERDRERYQTVFARVPGAVAAPTAGLHFSRQLLDRLSEEGVATAAITLHVGPGTFLPVRTARIEDHTMHAERYTVSEATAVAITETRARGGRIVAVGTTVVRALESAVDAAGEIQPGSGATALFIIPGYRFRVVDAMVTNFHLPRSTLLMLVAAFAGRERVLAAYREAVRERYRFYSYGDAMLVRAA